MIPFAVGTGGWGISRLDTFVGEVITSTFDANWGTGAKKGRVVKQLTSKALRWSVTRSKWLHANFNVRDVLEVMNFFSLFVFL